MPLFAVAFNSNIPKEGVVVNGVETSLHIVCDGKVIDAKTKANVLSEALKETACGYHENDMVLPDPNQKLEGGKLDVDVNKATLVTVVDNGQITVGKSTYRNAWDILKQLKIQVFIEDKITSDLIVSDFNKNGIGQKIIIQRSPAVILEADGNIGEFRTNQETVGAFLAERGINLQGKDEVSPGLNSRVKPGLRVSVNRFKESLAEEEEVISFQSVVKEDFNLHQGITRTESEGANGKKKKMYKITTKNGSIQEKILVSETITVPVKNKIVVSGVKPYGYEDLWAIMVKAGAEWGVDPSEIYRVGQCESHLNPNSVGFAVGLMQYKPATWASATAKYPGGKYVGASIFDPTAQIYVTAWKVSTNGWREWACKP